MTVQIPSFIPNCKLEEVAAENAALAALDQKLLVARDRIRQVARGDASGFYWYGRPGTAKTHTVLTTLIEMGVKHAYEKGHVTGQGLLELMEKHHSEIIVLDDVSAIFSDKRAVQYLMAALGRMNGAALPMSYVRQGQSIRFDFTGGIICISNLPIENKGMLAALKSRVHTLHHSPSDAMLVALCRHRICRGGWPAGHPKLSDSECIDVIDWVRRESQRIRVPIDLRVVLEKAMPDYLAWRNGQTEAHWHDLISTTLEEEVVSLTHAPTNTKAMGVRQATKEKEQEIVRVILTEFTTRTARLAAWKERTRTLGHEKSEKAFERRWAEIKALDTSENVSKVSESSADISDSSDTFPKVSA